MKHRPAPAAGFVLLLGAMLGGCGHPAPHGAGERLEAAAVAAGIVPDLAHATLAGSWARDTDRVCVVPQAAGAMRIGASVDYGDGQGCSASGTVAQSGESLRVAFGTCRFTARFDGARIVFPADLPEACETLCHGRASLAALSVERLSESVSEAETLRGGNGKTLCAD